MAKTKDQLIEALAVSEGEASLLRDELNHTYRELDSVTRDRDEFRQFTQHGQRDRREFEDILVGILDIHQPFVDLSNLTRGENREGRDLGIVLRCRVCRTPEHHTRGEENSELWPCATLRPFVRTSISAPANTSENDGPRSEGVSHQGETVTQQTEQS
jgi:hypothetical protein